MPSVQLTSFSTGYSSPLDVKHAGDSRIFIVERGGRIYISDSLGNKLATAFLDISAIVESGTGQSEQGLLSMAFHPNYSTNGYFYVNYIDLNEDSKVSRFSVSGGDPNVADAGSELVLMTVAQPFWNHNGSNLAFGPDGYLYISFGDGGSANDPGNRAQNRQLLLGKMLRIDVDTGSPYGIPANNPFVNDANTLDEIWAIGLRNPWRYSFDRLTGDMWIGDVGQGDFEEIDFEPDTSVGGRNYGWRCYEGNDPFNTSGCGQASDYVFPVHVYDNNFTSGCSVTGGYVYRGSDYSGMYGHYIFCDFCSGIYTSIWMDSGCGFKTMDQGNHDDYKFSSFGENRDGEVFVTGLSDGVVYRVEDVCDGVMAVPTISHSGGTLSSTSADSYQWYLGCDPVSGATSMDYTPAQNGEYRVWVESTSGCAAFSARFEYPPINNAVAGYSAGFVSIFPNPASSEVMIELKETGANSTLQLTNLQGQVVMTVEDVSNRKIVLDCSNLENGVYFLQLSGDAAGVAKLMIQK